MTPSKNQQVDYNDNKNNNNELTLLLPHNNNNNMKNDNNNNDNNNPKNLLLIKEEELNNNNGRGSYSNNGNNSNNSNNNNNNGSASVIETIINLTKACMGTGCLALPFAAQQGGLLLYIFGTIVIAIWNVFSSYRLCQCLDLLSNLLVLQQQQQQQQQDDEDTTTTNNNNKKKKNNKDNDMTTITTTTSDESATLLLSKPQPQQQQLIVLSPSPSPPPPPIGTSTLGKIAWYSLNNGSLGLNIIDIMTILLLIGIIITYQDATRSFLLDTPIHTKTGWIDTIVISILMASLSIVPNLGYLSKASIIGLFVLLFVFIVITIYGIVLRYDTNNNNNNNNIQQEIEKEEEHYYYNSNNNNNTNTIYTWWLYYNHWLFPLNGLMGICNWFGCTVFSFGIVPLTFNFQESMKEPKKYVKSTIIALVGIVSTLYICIGIGLLLLYNTNTNNDSNTNTIIIEGDILHELTFEGFIPIITRLALVIVIIMTTPLLIVPCCEIIYGKLILYINNKNTNNSTTTSTTTINIKTIIPFCICLLSAAISVAIPGFVNVLSFVGCFCVAFVSFIIPPLLHLLLLQKIIQYQKNKRQKRLLLLVKDVDVWIDLFLLLCGILCTAISTTLVFENLTTTTT